MEKLKLYVISHTHWDREWYQTFQNYRYRLVRAMDNLICGLEQNEEYKVFHLDGQTIVLEDYLEIRPEMEDRLIKLIRDGRIVIGPWYVMPDEFLISGESLIKNLQMGHAICKKYGVPPMKNGYVTDIFGHNSQFPQILNGFDIHSATLYRGIGDFEKDAFRWQSPDGSEVIAAKLEAERSYSNFYFAVRWPYEESGFDEKHAVERMKVLVARAREMAASNMVLMMDGVDHGAMEPELPKMLRLFEKEIPDIEFVHTNIEEYFSHLDKSSLELIQGSLYHVAKRGLNNQLLKNVLSSMVHIKQENDKCETYLNTVAESLNAFCEMNCDKMKNYRRDDYSLAPRGTYLDTAWKYLIQNHPHDSICGCSLSEVHRDNEYRFRQAYQMAEISAKDCVNVISRNIRCNGNHQEAVLLYNPSQKPIDGVCIFSLSVKHHEAPNRRFYDSSDNLLEVQVLEEREETLPESRLLQLIHFERMSKLTVAAKLEIPAFGYTTVYCDHLQSIFRPEEKAYGHDVYYPPHRLRGTQMTAHNRIDNGALIVELNEAGLLNVMRKKDGRIFRNLHLLEDRSDMGEGWNWRPAVYDRTIYNVNNLVQFSVISDGPLCTVWKLTYTLRLPVGADKSLLKRSEREQEQLVTTILTVPKDSEMLYFKTNLKNKIENHRLRVLFPTYLSQECFYTKTPFDFTRWEVKGEDDCDRAEPDTLVHPSQGITRIGQDEKAVALYAKGLYEIEVTDNHEKALALTLFRSAQSETGTCHPKDIKMQREMTFEYALSFAGQSPTETMLEGECYRVGIKEFPIEQNSKAENLDSCGSFLRISENQKIVSHISEREGSFYLRLYDISGVEEKVIVTLPKRIVSAKYVDFKGGALYLENQQENPEIINENQVTVLCPPHKIVTIQLQMMSEGHRL